MFRLSFALLLGLCALAARAQDDPPGRVGRLAELRGAVSWWDHESGRWTDAERNQPLTSGDRISTAGDGSVDVRVGSTQLHLAERSELEVLRLDDERLSFELHSGSVALRVRSRELASEIDLRTNEARLEPMVAGSYRLDRRDDISYASVWRGELRIAEPNGFVVNPGQRVEMLREGRGGALRFKIDAPLNDRFAEAVLRDEQRDERSASAKYVSPEMTGIEDLDRNGRWEQHPEFGAIWLPLQVGADWAPYRDGRWAWVRPWGWTWVDNAPWGFAPFHYGRWMYWRNSWAWVPGAYVARPVYAPALVAWVGGEGSGISIQIGGPRVGWLPLAPREVFMPHYAVSPVYRDRINPNPPYRWNHAPNQPPRGPVVWGNQGAPRAVTVAPRDALQQRPAGGRGWADAREGRDGRDERDARGDARRPNVPQPLLGTAPPAPPPGVGMAPSRPGRAPEQAREIPPREARGPQPREERAAQPREDRGPQRREDRGGPANPGRPAAQPAAAVAPAAPVAPERRRAEAPAPAAAPAPAPAPVAAPAAAPAAKPAAERPREQERERERDRGRERERERERRPQPGEGQRKPDGEREK